MASQRNNMVDQTERNRHPEEGHRTWQAPQTMSVCRDQAKSSSNSYWREGLDSKAVLQRRLRTAEFKIKVIKLCLIGYFNKMCRNRRFISSLRQHQSNGNTSFFEIFLPRRVISCKTMGKITVYSTIVSGSLRYKGFHKKAWIFFSMTTKLGRLKPFHDQ